MKMNVQHPTSNFQRSMVDDGHFLMIRGLSAVQTTIKMPQSFIGRSMLNVGRWTFKKAIGVNVYESF